jgi:dipeptidyl aminopeptidase/acylaminoacyl peptidase
MPAIMRLTALCLLLASFILRAGCENAEKRPITASDCVKARYLDSAGSQAAISINAQGTMAAYLVKAPNLRTNENDIYLYVRDFPGAANERSRLLGSNVGFSEMHWLRDGRHLAILMQLGSHVGVASIDVKTGARTILQAANSDIEDYSIDAAGDTIAYSTSAPSEVGQRYSKEQLESGYRIPNQGNPAAAEVRQSLFREKYLFVARRLQDGRWAAAKRISIRHPLSGKLESRILCTDSFSLSLSPNGQKLLLDLPGIDLRGDLNTSDWPRDWNINPDVKERLAQGTPIMLSALLDLASGNVTMPIATLYVSPGPPLWARDSRSFLVGAMSPVGSEWEAADDQAGIDFVHSFHVWRVDFAHHDIQLVARNFSGMNKDLLSYDGEQATLRVAADTFAVYNSTGGSTWGKVSETHLPVQDTDEVGAFAAARGYVLAGYENTVTPPEITLYKVGSSQIQVVDQLDPQFGNLTIAPVRPFSWDTSTGVRINGLLFLPTSYVSGHHYPLVIETKASHGQFLCDGGEDHPPSFAPQPLANDGIAYLLSTGSPDTAFYPTGYPGGVAEAAFYTDIWGSAVSALSKAGIIDKDKVGIIGFSRTGWHVEYALSHGSTHYAAATAADNIEYSYGEYWVDNAAAIYALSGDDMYGGPPYGSTLKNWLRYSISFNLDQIHTPLLMEEMGYGVRDDHAGEIPFNLAPKFEILAGLTRLGKPIEMYYYPDEDHEPDHPKARLASLQRNIDWYRFWLQGYERPDPTDREQYDRWRKLKQLHQRDLETLSPAAKTDHSGS